MPGATSQPSASGESAASPSRRRLLAGAGLATTAGLTLGAPGIAEAGGPRRRVAVGPEGGTVVEFRGRIAQTGSSGEVFTSIGYLIRATGARSSDLFAAGAPSQTTALFTAYATGDLSARVLDQSVHSLDIVGQLTVYQRSAPGADWANPASFTVGTAVARFDLRLQDVLAVFAPGQGLPTLTGDMVQTSAGALGGGLAGAAFGQEGQRLRMFAAGLGTLVDPVTLNANLEIAGNWSAE